MLLLLGQLNLSAGGGSVTLVVSDALHAHTADSLTITTSSVLAIQEALHSHTADSLTITTSSVLAIQEALHAHTADSLTLTVPIASGAYWVAHPDGMWPGTPTGDQIAQGKLSDDSAAAYMGFETAPGGGSGTITESTPITGLLASSSYRVAWVVYDAVAHEYSNVVVGAVSTAAPVVSIFRTYLVTPQDRIASIGPEVRMLTIPPENRTLTV